MIYRRLFQEKAITINEASNEGLALFVNGDIDSLASLELILYNPKELSDDKYVEYLELEENNDFKFIFQSLFGFIKISNYNFNAYGSWTVNMIAAKKGYGILLYDIILSMVGKKGLCPDRGSVSSHAEKVWDYYLNKRNDVINKPIDDEDHPLTKPKKDDSHVHKPFKSGEIDLTKRSSIDRVYYMNKKLNFKSLITNHNKFIQSSKYITENDFEDKSEMLGIKFYKLQKSERINI